MDNKIKIEDMIGSAVVGFIIALVFPKFTEKLAEYKIDPLHYALIAFCASIPWQIIVHGRRF